MGNGGGGNGGSEVRDGERAGGEGRERRRSTGMLEIPKRKRDILEWLEGAEDRRKAKEKDGFKRSK